jgi:hypothetical protein
MVRERDPIKLYSSLGMRSLDRIDLAGWHTTVADMYDICLGVSHSHQCFGSAGLRQ